MIMEHPSTISSDSKLLVVPYCTIGYRSGVLCNKLLNDVRIAAAVKAASIEVRNGAGVVPFSHEPCVNTNPSAFVVPATNEPTKTIHVFGTDWDALSDEYTSVTFGNGGFFGKLRGALWSLYEYFTATKV
jgi:hypothetical protein